MKRIVLLLVLLLNISLRTEATLSVGDTLIVYASYSEMFLAGAGTTEENEVLDSVANRGDTTFLHFTVVDRKNEFAPPGGIATLINKNHTQLVIISSKPVTIQESSSRFNGVEWILPDKSSMLFFESISRFSAFCPIPIDPSEEEYGDEDFFIVRVTDSIGMRWSEYPENPIHLKGQLMVFNGKDDLTGTILTDSTGFSEPCGSVSPFIISGNGNGIPLLHFSSLVVPSHCCTFDENGMVEEDICYTVKLLGHKPLSVGIKRYPQREGLQGSFGVKHKYSLLGRKVPWTLDWADNFFIVSDREKTRGLGYLSLKQATLHP